MQETSEMSGGLNKAKVSWLRLARQDRSELIISYRSRTLSASTDDEKQADCDWGSDFEESASTPPPQRHFQFKKVEYSWPGTFLQIHI